MTVCTECLTAEQVRDFGLYNLRRWCCRARHIVDASVSLSARGLSLGDVRRKLCRAERTAHPEDWPLVRRRLDELAEREVRA